jgi:hypothetical protein
VAQLVEIKVDQELEEVMRHQHVLWHQPCVLDIMANNSSKDFNWSKAEVNEEMHSNSEDEPTTTTDHGGISHW